MNDLIQSPTETSILVELTDLADSPFQKPRVSDRGKVDELASSMRQIGVLNPLIARVRPGAKGEHYELVAGHRRKRGAARAELTAVPVFVREYSDDQVLEIIAVENGQREGVHPLDEADLYAELVKRGRSNAEIADKVGRSPAFVAQRLQLQQLTKRGREALDENRLTLGAALALARVPSKLQDEALDEIMGWHEYGDDEGAAATAAGVRKLLEEQFMLRLDRATFPLDDAQLYKKAGACTGCRKRTGNQAALFDDVANDMCTDTACFKEKTKLYWPVKVKAARDAGQTVLEGDAARKAISGATSYGSGAYTRVDGEMYLSGRHEPTPVRDLVKKAGAPVVLAQNEDGDVVELVRRDEVEKVGATKRDRATAEKDEAASRRRMADARRRARVVDLAIAAAVQEAEKRATGGAAAYALMECIDTTIRGAIIRAWSDTLKAILARRKLVGETKANTSPEAKVLKLYESMTKAQRVGLGVELGLMSMHNYGGNLATSGEWKAALKTLDVDLDKLERQVADEAKAKKAAKKAPKKGTTAKASKTKPTKTKAKR